jgi:hypothetical protein
MKEALEKWKNANEEKGDTSIIRGAIWLPNSKMAR